MSVLITRVPPRQESRGQQRVSAELGVEDSELDVLGTVRVANNSKPSLDGIMPSSIVVFLRVREDAVYRWREPFRRGEQSMAAALGGVPGQEVQLLQIGEAAF